MNRSLPLIGATLLLGLVLAFSLLDVEPVRSWRGLLLSDAQTQITRVLGKERVMRQQVLEAIAVAQADITRLEDLAIASEVDAEILDAKLAELHERAQSAQAELHHLGTLVQRGQPVTLASGALLGLAELKTLAQTKITAYQTLQQRIAAVEQSQRIHRETASRAKTAAVAAQQNVANLTSSLELLDAKVALLQAVQSQPVAGLADSKVAGVVSETETLMEGVLGQVERELRIAAERSAIQQAQALDEASLPALPSDDGLAAQLFALAGKPGATAGAGQ